MNGYLLTIAVLVVTAGRLGDMFGRKRVFLVGMAVFAAGSVALRRRRRPGDADRRPGAAGRRRGADAVALAGARLQRLPGRRSSRGRSGSGRRSRRWRWRSGRWPAALLIEIDWRVIFWMNLPVAALGIAITGAAPRRSRPTPAPGTQDRLAGPGRAQRRAHRGRPGAGPGAGLGRRADARPGPGRRRRRCFAFWRIEHRVARADRRLRPLPQRPLLRRQRRRLRPGRRLLGGDVLPAAVPAGRARPLGRRQRPADPADHRADGLHLALLRPADRPLRRPPADDRRDGLRHRSACSSSPRSAPTAPTRCCSPATCCSGSPSASSTRRCRPRRWRRCRRRRSGSPPGCWRWTGSWPAPSPSPPPAPSSTPCSATATRSPPRSPARPGFSVGALRGRRRPHLGLRPRSRAARAGPAVAGDPPPSELRHHRHHRRFHL